MDSIGYEFASLDCRPAFGLDLNGRPTPAFMLIIEVFPPAKKGAPLPSVEVFPPIWIAAEQLQPFLQLIQPQLLKHFPGAASTSGPGSSGTPAH